jgi:hypothetical protein
MVIYYMLFAVVSAHVASVMEPSENVAILFYVIACDIHVTCFFT